ncbi:uncharacterized protein [Nothobranchius furzeri]|nr:uncharacterized protein LOC129163769 isoform X2 [Nothobranchius furzeri]
MLQIFYKSVVESVISSAIVCWGSSIRSRDLKRLNSLITKAGSVLGTTVEPLEEMMQRRILQRIKTMMDNPEHSLHKTVRQRKSVFSQRLLQFGCNTDRYWRSFLPTAIDTEPVEDQINSMKMGILTVIEDDVATVQSSPNIRFFAVVLEEQIVVDEVSDLPTAFALLFGLIYALNMDYPKELKYTFETIQKVFMCLDPKCSARVQSFKNKLLQY